jgi:predicted metal-dependent phosphoesterase TrpH
MKFDMHCHTKEGSVDAKVPVREYIRLLKEQGFDGMLISDHDSYDGYRYWRMHRQEHSMRDFVVLRGVEYDTVDGGHFLVILPSGIGLKILEIKGMPVQLLIHLVHHYGGILGPAHPCGERYLSLFSTRKYAKNHDIALQMDFLEGFNSCENAESNQRAAEIAEQYGLPVFGGSDSHRADCIGTGFTEFDGTIRREDDLIAYIRQGKTTVAGGTHYLGTTKDRLGIFNQILVQSFWFYNKLGALIAGRKRKAALENARRKSQSYRSLRKR